MKPNKTIASLLILVSTLTASAQTDMLSVPPIAKGPFKPDWESLKNYECPDWFRDAKFGIWAHWGAQCQPEGGDWYARNMYIEGSRDYKSHVLEYGHPSKVGFKDVIREWKAEKFEPEKLVKFYKENGAKYFMALAVHCDNFDNWDSKFQPWNSVKLGPQKDLIAGWAAATRNNGLRFGVSVHNGGWSWSWYETSQGADTKGPLAGLPYDGKLTKADGQGQWWEGLDPQQLYAQNHAIGAKPDRSYCEKFFLRTKQLWDDYEPDLIYFDENIVPMHRIGGSHDYGLNLYAHFYNSSIQRHGKNEAVVNAKGLSPLQRQGVVYDIERGKTDKILPQPWQTDTCIGQWFYDKEVYNRHGYKSAASVIRMLIDIVSKNGNLMLSIPLQRDGQPDSDEIQIVNEIGAWLKTNGGAIYGTRPWKIYGEGPSTKLAGEKNRYGGVKDVESKPFTPEDVRFTQSKDGKTLYAIVLEIPKAGKVTITSLASGSDKWPGKIGVVRLLSAPVDLKFSRDQEGLHVTLPENHGGKTAMTLSITG